MASTAAMAITGSSAALVAAPTGRNCFSSSATFGSSPVVKIVPAAQRSRADVSVRAAGQLPEGSKAARREVLTGLFAAGALIASTPAYALTGPGGDGAAGTAEKAGDLLNEAQKLTENESPPTFGRGGVQGAVQEAGSTAQQAGAGVTTNTQDVADAAVASAKANLSKLKKGFGNIIKE